MMPSYLSLLNRLLAVNVNGGMKLGLENTKHLSQIMGDPHHTLSTVHVAGTNGKGSVSTKIASALQHSGRRVGLYTSPHIACFRERIRINGEMISEEQVQKHLIQIFSAVDQYKIPATFFEITTLLALLYFAEENIDFAVMETGLGGRLDATNIIQPELSVITSISLDHTDILGDTIEAIAQEKAGIIKPNTPVVIGPRVPRSIIEPIAAAQGSPCIQIQGHFDDYHAENCAIAERSLQLLQIDPRYIAQGIQALPPCRLETLKLPDQPLIILDVAHNPHGFEQLLMAIRHRYGKMPIRFVMGLSSNKDTRGCLNIAKSAGTHYHLVEAPSTRAASQEELRTQLISLGIHESMVSSGQSIPEAILSACCQAKQQGEIVVICGTFYIMNAARQVLGLKDAQDPYDLNEKTVTQ